jgi:hypothetical protein
MFSLIIVSFLLIFDLATGPNPDPARLVIGALLGGALYGGYRRWVGPRMQERGTRQRPWASRRRLAFVSVLSAAFVVAWLAWIAYPSH